MEIVDRIGRVTRLLCEVNRQVTDDAALNNLLSEIKILLEIESFHEIFHQTDQFQDILKHGFDQCEHLPTNNLAFLLELFGILIDINEQVDLNQFKTISESSVYEREALIRSSWLESLRSIIVNRPHQTEVNDVIKVILKSSNDCSIFVQRQAHLVTIGLLKRHFDDEEVFSFIIKSTAFTNQDFLYSMMVSLKTDGDVKLFEAVFKQINKENRSARLVLLYLSLLSLTGVTMDPSYLLVDFHVRDHFTVNFLGMLISPQKNFELLVKQVLPFHTNSKVTNILDTLNQYFERLDSETVELMVEELKSSMCHLPPKTQIVAVNFLIKTLSMDNLRTKAMDILLDRLKDGRNPKIKYRIILAFGDHPNCVTYEEVQMLLDLYFERNWETKDAILECFSKLSEIDFPFNKDEIQQILKIIEAGLSDEIGGVRGSALLAKSLFLIERVGLITDLINFTSKEMDFTVRRTGVRCITRVIKYHPEIPIDYMTSEGVNQCMAPILEFKRTEVKYFHDFINYLARDDDWEVRELIIDLIEVVRRISAPLKEQNPLDKCLAYLSNDSEPSVASKAYQAILHSGDAPKVEDELSVAPDLEALVELLTDIELNLNMIREKEELCFSDGEGEDFADCY